MKKLLIPALALLLAGCSGDKPSSPHIIDANPLFESSTPVKPLYLPGDKVLSKLGIVCVILNCEIIENKWKLYAARALMTDRNGIMRMQNVELYEFEIKKKID